MNLFKSFIYKINSNNGASNTQEDSQKLNIDMTKYFTNILFLSAKPLERCLKLWKHISQTVFIIIFSIFVWANISLLIKDSSAVFYAHILLDLTVFKEDW